MYDWDTCIACIAVAESQKVFSFSVTLVSRWPVRPTADDAASGGTHMASLAYPGSRAAKSHGNFDISKAAVLDCLAGDRGCHVHFGVTCEAECNQLGDAD